MWARRVARTTAQGKQRSRHRAAPACGVEVLREQLLAEEAADYGNADQATGVWANGVLASSAAGLFMSLKGKGWRGPLETLPLHEEEEQVPRGQALLTIDELVSIVVPFLLDHRLKAVVLVVFRRALTSSAPPSVWRQLYPEQGRFL